MSSLRQTCSLLLLGFAAILMPGVQADEVEGIGRSPAYIALIIDDMGNRREAGEAALALPGAITYSFLPHTPFAKVQAGIAHATEREVMLHLPMESNENYPLGTGGLTMDMERDAFVLTLAEDIASIPYVAGINNHMGSRMTSDAEAMRWLMAALRDSDLFFIDSRTTDQTQAETVARENLVAVTRRNVFLDNERDPEAIRMQFQNLIRLAKRDGSAVGIGHPHPETLEILAEMIPLLEREGVQLVPASHLTNQERRLWHASSSPSPKAVKNSKPPPSPIY
ncbi:MAG: divergent polysaccharide deacetylase family protein [gamma proteobacterium endosymbiont of Lamellibrachia anaximandri]|nr:divergent polysaccharide deacetylase family protein [gamma proteobacterium endosymbiont of Lamellibrachia anaximandri]